MEFKEPYLLSMQENDPALFKSLIKSGQMQAHLQAKSVEAHALLKELLQDEPKGPSGLAVDQTAQSLAEERVRGQLIQFPGQAPNLPVEMSDMPPRPTSNLRVVPKTTPSYPEG